MIETIHAPLLPFLAGKELEAKVVVASDPCGYGKRFTLHARAVDHDPYDEEHRTRNRIIRLPNTKKGWKKARKVTRQMMANGFEVQIDVTPHPYREAETQIVVWGDKEGF